MHLVAQRTAMGELKLTGEPIAQIGYEEWFQGLTAEEAAALRVFDGVVDQYIQDGSKAMGLDSSSVKRRLH